jgi:phosphonate degradation associated HDIG domain protein
MIPAPTTLDEVLAIYDAHGHRAYGESVTELEHALQCATLAQDAGEPPEVVAAALLHDLGHLCHQLGEDVAAHGVDAQHERLGHALLAPLFTDAIADACRLHVSAKRYLCRVDPAYAATLSEASQRSLALQGGAMDAADAAAFEREPHGALAVRVRRYDDLGKVPGMSTPALRDFVPLLRRFLREQA